MATTKIEYVTDTWNPVTGCTPVSPGCDNCYARSRAQRLRGRCGYPADDPFQVTLHSERLEQPLGWNKSRRVFVCSMGDLFHEDVPFWFISKSFRTMWLAEKHVFLVLTKRAERMVEYFGREESNFEIAEEDITVNHFPLENVWLGVTAENQEQANKRLPILCKIPAAVKFVSVEPMLGPVDLSLWMVSGYDEPPHDDVISWVICGPETGPGRRHTAIDDIRDLRDQCVTAGLPFFLKAMEIDGRIVKAPKLDGREWLEYPCTS